MVQTRIVRIYRREYRLPVLLNDSFEQQHRDIRQRCQLVKEGKPTFLGLIRKPLSVDESIKTLNSLITDYETIINLLQSQKTTYNQFFIDLILEIQDITTEKFQKIADLEQKRITLAKRVEPDSHLQLIYQNQQEQLLKTSQLVASASLLMLKKLELMRSALAKLTEDQEIQRQILSEMHENLSVYVETYWLQKEITDLQEEAADMAEVAIEFEKYIGNYLGSLQNLISEVVKLDQNLLSALEEIKGLTDMILGESELLLGSNEELSNWPMNWLTQSAIKQSRLPNALKDMEKEVLSAVEIDLQILLNNTNCDSVTDTLAKIQLHLEPLFNQLIQFGSIGQSPIKKLTESKTEISTPEVLNQDKYFLEDLGWGVNLEMLAIKEGTFLMGSPKNYECPEHQVTIKPFWMSKYPVAQAQWQAVASLPQVNRELNPDPSYFKDANRPVEKVSWYDAVEFCDRLSQYTGKSYRLPSEAEWEYTCRAGTTTPFHFGETITSELANYRATETYGAGPKGIYREETTVVGSFRVANVFGLYDMHGNVWEWCLDDWHSNYEGAPTDGSAWLDDNDNLFQKQERALLRGGSWLNIPGNCRSAYRYYYTRDGRLDNVGFRVVCATRRIA